MLRPEKCRFVRERARCRVGSRGACLYRDNQDGRRIASPEMFPGREVLPHLICCRPGLAGGVGDEAAEHGDA
jgi:hypothetical protein